MGILLGREACDHPHCRQLSTKKLQLGPALLNRVRSLDFRYFDRQLCEDKLQIVQVIHPLTLHFELNNFNNNKSI